MFDTTKYIKIPFLDHGRNFDGCDCYGLVRLIYKNEFGIELPLLMSYLDSTQGKEISVLIEDNIPLLNAKKVNEPEIGTIAIFNIKGFPMHMGVYIGNNRVLHVMKGTNSLCEKFNSGRLKGRLEGYYEIR